MKLRPDNISSMSEWKSFVKEKTSEKFKSHFHETKASENPPKTPLTSPMSVKAIPNITKCKMLDLEGSDTVVAE
ncbi:hypothetical protein CICLE_v10017456mg [Citrus x clementina]|uniref:Uncharacterized protein n=1 Tax=Citrus clementina TaxID=85681 RepID=V4TL78_CITCL|nr:hypothetical protein CICLE_v10017456mg [Citrus x clementina]